MELTTYTPNVEANPFADDIAKLAELTFGTETVKAQPELAATWNVPAADAGKSKYKIGKAANAINRTAALVSERAQVKDGKPVPGMVALTFRLKDKHQSGTRNRTPKAVEAPVQAPAKPAAPASK